MLGLFRRVLILKRVRDRNSLVGSSETMPRVRMLSPLPTWMSPYSLWLAVCIRHMYYFDVSVIVQSFTLRFPIAGASDQSNKVPVPTNSVSPADPANQQNVYAHSSNLLNLLRGSQENTSPSKMDVRALGKIQFGDCKRAMPMLPSISIIILSFSQKPPVSCTVSKKSKPSGGEPRTICQLLWIQPQL